VAFFLSLSSPTQIASRHNSWSKFKVPKEEVGPRWHSYDILGARMLWKPKEARILKNFKKIYRSTSVIW
jgi:hypothetical protein